MEHMTRVLFVLLFGLLLSLGCDNPNSNPVEQPLGSGSNASELPVFPGSDDTIGKTLIDRFPDPAASHCHGEPGNLACCSGPHPVTCGGDCSCFGPDGCELLKAFCTHPGCDTTYTCDVDGLVCHCRQN